LSSAYVNIFTIIDNILVFPLGPQILFLYANLKLSQNWSVKFIISINFMGCIG